MPNLTPHFTWAELRYDATPVAYRPNVALLAALLEAARAAGGNVPLRITSAYRDELRNRLAGGSPVSQHLTGSAADFKPLGDAETWFNRVRTTLPPASFGQLIYYAATTKHLHISLPNRSSGKTGEVLVEYAPGKYRRVTGEAVADDSREGVAGLGTLLLILLLSFMLLEIMA